MLISTSETLFKEAKKRNFYIEAIIIYTFEKLNTQIPKLIYHI
jgi:hypothetical protein